MTEEALAILDILTRSAPELSTKERAEVKQVASERLSRLQSDLERVNGIAPTQPIPPARSLTEGSPIYCMS
jgi:hypothetical protein